MVSYDLKNPYEERKGKNTIHSSLAQVLKKYELNQVGYEYIPALMNTLARYVHDVKNRTDFEGVFFRNLDSAKIDKKILSQIVENYNAIPTELKVRIFSPQYLYHNNGISTSQMYEVVQSAYSYHTKRASLLHDYPTSFDTSRSAPIQFHHFGHASENCCCEPVLPVTNNDNATPPHTYLLTFEHLQCIRESGRTSRGHDEVALIFGTITEEMAQNNIPPQMASVEYTNVDTGEGKPSSGTAGLRLYGLAGPAPININFLTTITLIERDFAQLSELTEQVRNALQTNAQSIIATGNPWIIAGALVGFFATFLIDMIVDDDPIGTREIIMTEQIAEDLTESPPHVFDVNGLRFDGGCNGVHEIDLRLIRVS
ncbi:MAG: hypothetical protein K5798_01975 [Nitrosopumilus sp.]|uniref:hypothetical protein n=1 Tax=Nitrosopumilus sp. TaxID=2024843 RepID=UPI00242CD1F0|nr:hypothetical protein [Nitrosopumilus sp.]MCV0366017.1 hypothetical protein [Nitrosopumilus sp.]